MNWVKNFLIPNTKFIDTKYLNYFLLFNSISGLEDEINLEEDLDALEQKILKAIEREKGNQAIIDDFRHKCQEIHDWFDSVLKKMCLVDKGSGLPCPQKLNALKELSTEFGQAGKGKVDAIKSVGGQVINIVSNLESQQVEEQVSVILLITQYSYKYYIQNSTNIIIIKFMKMNVG